MSIMHVRIYYKYCAPYKTSLASFPRTTAGEEMTSLVSAEGTCVANAVSVSASCETIKHVTPSIKPYYIHNIHKTVGLYELAVRGMSHEMPVTHFVHKLRNACPFCRTRLSSISCYPDRDLYFGYSLKMRH